MDMRFAPLAIVFLFLTFGCASQGSIHQLANPAGPTFHSLDTFRLNESEIPAGYVLEIEAHSDSEMAKMSPDAEHLGIGLPLEIRTDVYRSKNVYLFSSAPNISAFKEAMQKHGISQEINSSVSEKIGRLPPHGWATFVLGKSAYLVKYNESGSLDVYTNSRKSGFAEMMMLYPAENASKIMQNDKTYVGALAASGNWSVSRLQTLQSPNGAIAYLVESKPVSRSAAFHVDQAIGNVFVKISVVTDPENQNPSDRTLAIGIAQLVANKSQANNPT